MKVKTISPFTILLSSISVFIFGIVVLFNIRFISNLTLNMISIYLLIIGVLHILSYIFNRKNTMLGKLSLGILYIILSLFIKFYPEFFRISAIRIIGIYAFLNTTYSYGTYDSSSNRLFTLVSDGVLIEVETDKYIEILNTQFNRSLIGFTLALTKAQHELIKNRINKIKSNCYLWKCPAQLSPNEYYPDETNIMYLEANCKYYKFKSGYFKTYFTLTANCFRLADTIVGSAGLDLIAVNGIITPGTYYNYLENLFRRKNTIVIEKKIYKKYTNN